MTEAVPTLVQNWPHVNGKYNYFPLNKFHLWLRK